MANIGGGRLIHFCEAADCRQADDHPRHHAVLANGTVQTRHLDCCAAAGCPDGSCNVIIDHAGDKRGGDLLAHILEHGDTLHAMVREAVESGN